MVEGSDHESRLETVAHRVDFLDLLRKAGPLQPRDVLDELEYSRPTVTRALRELREAGLVERTGDGYAATVAGSMAAAEYRRYERASRAILSAGALLEPIPPTDAPPSRVLVDATTSLAEEQVPVAALEGLSDQVRRSDAVRAYLPTLVNTHLLRVWHRAVTSGSLDSGAILHPDLLTELKGQYPYLLAEMASTEGFTAHSTAGPSYGVIVTTNGEHRQMALLVYEGGTALRGILRNDTTAAVDWAAAELERLETAATEVTRDLDALSAAVADGLARAPAQQAGQTGPASSGSRMSAEGHPLPIDLEADGFRRLSTEYFDAHSEAAPAVSWRTGFTLAEVQAGHAVDRRDEQDRNLTERLLDALREHGARVLLGPPGSGKSTICMAVACEWFDRGVGPVLYRERGEGDSFDSPALLEAYLRQASGQVLVVVEDAIREEANAVFDVMQTLEADPSVAFLLDARTNEWREPGGVEMDTRLERYRQTGIEEVTVPPLDEAECHRFVDHFAALVDDRVEPSGEELYATLERGAVGQDGEVPAGDALVAQHHLASRYDPASGADASMDTALDGAVRDTYEAVAESEASMSREMAVLAALLTAAGIPVADEYLVSIAAEDGYEDFDGSLATLRGRLIFDQDRPRRGGPTTYRTRHEHWAVRFLEQFIASESDREACETFGECITRLLALADDPGRRERIERHLQGRTPYLHQIEADPQHWADEHLERVFALGRTNPSLTPLFGATTDDALQLPDACSEWRRLEQAYWRGRMSLLHADLDRAEREFRTLGALTDTLDLAGATGEPATPAFTIPADIESGAVDAHRERWRAASETYLGWVARDRGEYDAARAHHRDALTRFTEIGDRGGEANCLKELAFVAYLKGEYDRAREFAERGRDIAREIDATSVEATSLNFLGLIAKDQGEYERAVECQRQSIAIKRELGDEHGAGFSRSCLGMVAEARGQYDEARDHHERCLATFREMGARHGEAATCNNLGIVARKQGAYEEARALHQESLDIFSDLGASHGEAASHKNLGVVNQKLGKVDLAREYHEQSLAINRELGDAQREAIDRKNLGVLARLAGDLETAREDLTAAQETLTEVGDRLANAEVSLELGRLALAQDDVDTAEKCAREARDTFVDLGARHWRGRSDLLRGRIAAATDNPAVAQEHYETALETFEAVGAPQDALATLKELIQLSRRGGRDEEVRAWSERARETVAGAPEATAEQYRDWIEHKTPTRGGQ